MQNKPIQPFQYIDNNKVNIIVNHGACLSDLIEAKQFLEVLIELEKKNEKPK